MTTSKKRQYRTTTKDIPDRHEDKKFPTGISSTILGLQYFWNEIAHGGESGLTPEQFCEKTGFAEVYGAVQALYTTRMPVDSKNSESLGRVIHRLINQTRNIDFVDLRSLAQFVGLPTGLFLLFTQCVSDERRSGPDSIAARETALALMERIGRVVEVTTRYIRERPPNQPIFQRIYDDLGQQYMADIAVLKLWADAFNNK